MKLFKSKTENSSWIEGEREKAIRETIENFQQGQEKFLWRVQSNFEKELVCYRLVSQMNLSNVLVLAAKESSLLSWWKKFARAPHIRDYFVFVCENSTLAKYNTVRSRKEYKDYIVKAEEDDERGMFAIDSSKGIKDSIYFGGTKDRLKWLTSTDFDLVIVDEEQGASYQSQIYQILPKIQRKYTLYLWNTNISRGQLENFREEQVFCFPPITKQRVNATERKASQKEKGLANEKASQNNTEGNCFLSQRSKEEMQLIKEIEGFAKEKIKTLKAEDKGKRYTFTDCNQVVGEVAYAWFWFVEKEGVLIFRYKLDQNEKNAELYKDNRILVNQLHLQTIKNIIDFIVKG